ncbi:bifunctional metallophosphatase/5'-nucleotidase [Undibacterium parvum]|uniref:Bifunctional metallophosphatase/5'-nucleotidase n=1 Tax=Undibacterium parvum TaxID=401471 RepID=A0A3Q9BPS4_9BURK|nr:bifunctional metallophosphatase/5'-nucleotidase [Undibacterium parvum]AZP11743.1 bifunctional metallophosphatase/5'-nucleotidase [Undibacterium parvum]
MFKIKLLSTICALSLLAACATPESARQAAKTGSAEITIFSFNDFHGNLQAEQPVPYMAPSAPVHDGHGHVGAPTAAGGYAYFASMLKQRRAAVGASILVGAGDLMGASPIASAMLRDEPVIAALNQLGLSVTALGNHEFDAGGAALQAKLAGICPTDGCAFPGFSGAKYDYIAANVSKKSDGSAWVKPYVIRQVGEFKVAFIGAVTSDTPNLVAGDGVKDLHFEEEANAINRYVPEIQRQGVAAIVLLIHEGASYQGAANDPSYACEGLQGPIIAISKKLDKAISLVVSGHTHQGYTCKIDGRLLVQARSYGAYLTETTLTIDRSSQQVIKAVASNHLIEQSKLSVDPEAQQLLAEVASLTAKVRTRPVTRLSVSLTRASEAGKFDSSLGNVIADAQLTFAKSIGKADFALMNAGGIRSDLVLGKQGQPTEINYGDIYAVQPFGNTLISMQLTGEKILALLQQQWQGGSKANPKKLFVSDGFSYRWKAGAEPANMLQDVRLHGLALDPLKQYTVVVNSFLADGGDGFTVFKQGTERKVLGRDLEAFEQYMRAQGADLTGLKTDRVQRLD